MGGFGSGGANRLSIDEHVARGTLRPSRHLALAPPRPPEPVSKADRKATLEGLGAAARRVVSRLLTEYDGWDTSSLATLRAYGLSCGRLADLEAVADDDSRRAELRINLALRRSLQLESPR